MPLETAPVMLKTNPRPVPMPLPKRNPESVHTLLLPRLLPAVASGALLWLCFFPVAWGWLGWAAMVPMLALIRAKLPSRPAVPMAGSSLAGRLVRALASPQLRIFFCSGIGALVFFVPILQWMRVGDPTMYVAWMVVAIVCAAFIAVTLVVARWIDSKGVLPLVMSFPAVWVGFELLRTHIGEGFPWYFLGHTQHAALTVIQISDMTGVYGVSFLVAAVNVIIFELLTLVAPIRRLFDLPPPRQSARSLAVQAAVVGLCVAATIVYGVHRLAEDDFATGPTVALVQGNLRQEVKNHGKPRDIFEHYLRKSQLVSRQQQKPDLIVWPETSFPGRWKMLDIEGTPNLDPQLEKSLPSHALARLNPILMETAYDAGVPIFIGTEALLLDQHRSYNSAVLLAPGRVSLIDGFAVHSCDFPGTVGEVRLVDYDAHESLKRHEAMPIRRGQVMPQGADAVILDSAKRCRAIGDGMVMLDTRFADEDDDVYAGQNLVAYGGRYDKIHRVPLGEYVPFKRWMPWLQKFTPYQEEYGVEAGENFTRLEFQDHAGKSYRFGAVICYEDTDPCLARQYVAPTEQPVDFIVNISNDGWFKGTAEHEQHLALARFRAIECRRSVIRSVNMGISAVIDSNGRVLAPRAVGGDDECALWECSAQDRAELPVSRWSEFKSVAGVLTVAVPIDDRGSLYARWGDWFAWSCAAVAAVTFVLALRRQRRFLAD